MSESTEAEVEVPVRQISSALVIGAIVALIAAVIWFASSQSGGSAAPVPVESPSVSAPAEPAPSAHEPSATPTPTVTAPPPPPPTPEEALASNIGRGFELTLDGAPATPLTANRFAAAYNVEAGSAPFVCETVKTSEGFIGIHPATNDAANGFTGVIYQGGC